MKFVSDSKIIHDSIILKCNFIRCFRALNVHQINF